MSNIEQNEEDRIRSSSKVDQYIKSLEKECEEHAEMAK